MNKRGICTIALIVLSACARPDPTVSLTPERFVQSEFAFESEREELGTIVRELSGTFSRGVVLMHGLETTEVGPYAFESIKDSELLALLARDASSEVANRGSYDFVRPAAYAPLDRFRVPADPGAALDETYAAISLGAGTTLFNALALLGHGTGTTIVADNAVAAAKTGELFLGRARLRETLEAILQSARLQNERVVFEQTDEFVFIRSTTNRHPNQLLLNAAELTNGDATVLNRRVGLRFPRANANPNGFETGANAQPLGTVLESMSAQLGLRVTAQEKLKRLPVNPVVMNEVRVRTAIELIIRQWLSPEFGYECVGGAIHIRKIERP